MPFPMTLEELLQPIALDTFLSDHWEKQPLHVGRGGSNPYAGLLSYAEIDQLLSYHNAPSVPVYAVANHGPARPQLNAQGMLETYTAYNQGDTVLLGSVEKRWPRIGALNRAIEQALRHPVAASVMMTPRNAQGFTVHFDPAEVLVLQLAGSKTWQVHEPVRPLPLFGERLLAPELLGPAREIELRAGDLLYLPRGFSHQAATSSEPSLHLSFYVNVIRWKDVVAHALAAAAEENEDLRRAVPPGLLASPGDTTHLQQELRRLLALLDGARVEDALQRASRDFVQQLQPLPDGHFTQLNEVEALELDTPLERRPGMLCFVARQLLAAELVFPGGSMSGPPYLEPALRFVTEHERFRPRELPGALSESSKLVLARRLIKDGLLRVARPGPSSDTGQ